LEPIDFFETESKSCPSFYPKVVQLGRKNVEFPAKEGRDTVFPFSCNTRNVANATVSTVTTALIGD